MKKTKNEVPAPEDKKPEGGLFTSTAPKKQEPSVSFLKDTKSSSSLFGNPSNPAPLFGGSPEKKAEEKTPAQTAASSSVKNPLLSNQNIGNNPILSSKQNQSIHENPFVNGNTKQLSWGGNKKIDVAKVPESSPHGSNHSSTGKGSLFGNANSNAT